MDEALKTMKAEEWRWLALLATDEARRASGNPEHYAKFKALADKCLVREAAALEGRCVP